MGRELYGAELMAYNLSIDGKSWQDYRTSAPGYGEPDSGYSFSDMRGAPLYDYSYGQVRDAAQSLGIKNVNKAQEVQAIVDRIRNPVAAAAKATQAQAQTQPAQQASSYTPTYLPVNDPTTTTTTTQTPATSTSTTSTPTESAAPTVSFSDQLSDIAGMFDTFRVDYEKQLADIQAANDARMTEMMNQMQMYQQQAAQSQRELMIGLQARDRDPADVRMARSRGQRRGLSGTGTTGYFGRGDLRISSLNVPTTNLAIPNTKPTATATGSFA